jgi:flagellar protein FlaG
VTQLVRALSTQEATATPSPSAVAFERAVAEKAPASPAQHPVQSTHAPPPAADVTEEVLKQVAKQIESYLKANGRDLQFSVDQETGRTVVTVRDSSTGEVIRQIPDVEALRIAQSLGQHPGTLLDVTI